MCHCKDCRKIGGFISSHNSIYPEEGFKVTKGTPKEWTKKADGGNEITSCFWYVGSDEVWHVSDQIQRRLWVYHVAPRPFVPWQAPRQGNAPIPVSIVL